MEHPVVRSLAVLCLLAGCSSPVAPVDASTSVDAGGSGTDTGVERDAFVAPPVDAGPPVPCAATYAGCGALEDHTGEATVSIAFAPTGFAYTPNCIRVSAGTVVTIAGSSLHPLRNATCSPLESPLPETATTAPGDYTFTAPGAYGYFCNNHGTNAGGGMAGLIVVE